MTPLKKLSNELLIPIIGYGTWQLQKEVAKDAVTNALEVGYRHIDTADRYGNHREVGEAIIESGIDRADIFLTTKLWDQSLKAENLEITVNRFLEEIRTDYIDLLLIHWPNKNIPIKETLLAMQECREAGKIKAIGVSNFTERHLDEVLEAGVDIVNNQIEVRPSFNQTDLRTYCDSKSISVTAYSSLRAGDMELPEIKELAVKYVRSPAQIIINWIISRGMVALPQSSNRERMKENLDSGNFQMKESDLNFIDSLPQGKRYNNPEFAEFD